MSNVYEGQPDARQSEAPAVKPEHSLFRKRYRQLTPGEVRLHDAIKDKADELAELFALLSPGVAQKMGIGRNLQADLIAATLPGDRGYDGANVTLAVRHLEDAVYRAIKALTS